LTCVILPNKDSTFRCISASIGSSPLKIYIEMSAILTGRLDSCFINFLKYICRHSIFFPDGKTISMP
jgi:hypothetical protein